MREGTIEKLALVMIPLLLVSVFAPFVTSATSSGFYSTTGSSGFSGSSVNTWQSSQPTLDDIYSGAIDDYWPILNALEKDQCDAVNSDFIIAIPAGGCSPTVVRSDLLAEQRVPVICQLSAIRVNPLIDVSTIKSISFKGDYPDGVYGISFHPARAAANSYTTLLGDPIEENIGYVVIILDRQANESNLEKEISGMLTATIRYDAENAFGVGDSEYYLEPMSDEIWETKAGHYSFWGGKGYIRAKSVDENGATIEVMSSKEDVLRTVILDEGETSSLIYYPGYYCTAALSVKLNMIDNSEDMARIEVDGNPYWVREGSKFIDNKCTVKELSVFPSGSGKIKISCAGSEAFTLAIGDEGVVLNNGAEVQVLIGGNITGEGNKKYYLGYYGTASIAESEKNSDGAFAVLFDSSLGEDDVSTITGVYESEIFETKEDLGRALEGISKYKGHYSLVFKGEEKYQGISFISLGDDFSENKFSESSGVPKYLGKAKDTTLSLVTNFSAEQKENEEYWGEEALYKQILLAGQTEDESMQENLINIFLATYPGSDSVEYLRDLKASLDTYSYGGSSKNVYVNNNYYNIHADGFAAGSYYSNSVNVRLDGKNIMKLEEGKVYSKNGVEVDLSNEEKTVPRLKVVDVSSSEAKFTYVWKDSERDSTSSKSVTIPVDGSEEIGGLEISVQTTDVREAAYVSIISEVRNTKTDANFTFNIEVEERAVEISPEKAQKKILELNETIAKWEDRLDKLGDFISGLKGACYAISAVLIVKSMFSGFSNGESIARGKVMDVYEKKCKSEGAKTSVELQKCYSKYSSEIESAIDGYGGGIAAVNSNVQCAETDKTVSSGLLESKVIDSNAYVSALSSCSGLRSDWSYKIGDTTVTKDHLTSASDYQAALLYEEVCSSTEDKSVSCQIAKQDLESALSDNVESVKAQNLAKSLGANTDDIYFDTSKSQKVSASQVTEAGGKTVAGVSLAKGTYYKIVSSGNNEYLYVMEKRSTGSLQVTKIYSDGKEVSANEFNSLSSKYTFVAIDPTSENSCSNEIKEPYVRYYETENKQGFAAIVPLSIKNGWYAYVESEDYSESGVANSFWICNVGADKKISEGTSGGDKCVQFRTSVGSDIIFTPCPTMSSSDVKSLYTKAEAAIREANKNGNGLTVDGQFVGKTTPMAAASLGYECTDFMSADNCNLMFNVCDPVVCPSSRCDLGGAFPVSDVVSTGIIGSLLLCLPNFGSPSEGGVLIPVCLSGIHAGIDSYLSILKSYRDCLQENVDSGEYTGICDEITAIYMCEFFWGQLSPILDVLLERFVEGLYGGFSTKGGAEYLTVQKSFERLDKSVDYFTNYYAENSFRAFELKNTEEIGSTVCKAFVGSSVPTSADAIDSLLEVDSPTQFYAYFSESAYSDATVPSTSQYKVYYHIYAGNDEGVQYRVYLSDPPETSYYSSRQTLLVDSDYVSAGESADESVDFTAPSGYKQLCVSINGEDECGFGTVTSNFAVDYATQEYIADQASDIGITTEEDCTTTSVSTWGLVSPNVQSGVETSLGQEDVANSGVVRVCASSNPSAGVVSGNDVYCTVGKTNSCSGQYTCQKINVDEDTVSSVGVCMDSSGNKQTAIQRWVDVGYCDDASVRCWLDSESVEGSLSTYLSVNNITNAQELALSTEDLTELDEEYKTVREKISAQKDKIEELEDNALTDLSNVENTILDIVVALDEIAGVEDDYAGQGTNADKAEALALKASLYRKIVEALMRSNPDLAVVGSKTTSPECEVDEECDSGVCGTNGKCVAAEDSNEDNSDEEEDIESVYPSENTLFVLCELDYSSCTYFKYVGGVWKEATFNGKLPESAIKNIKWSDSGVLGDMDYVSGFNKIDAKIEEGYLFDYYSIDEGSTSNTNLKDSEEEVEKTYPSESTFFALNKDLSVSSTYYHYLNNIWFEAEQVASVNQGFSNFNWEPSKELTGKNYYEGVKYLSEKSAVEEEGYSLEIISTK